MASKTRSIIVEDAGANFRAQLGTMAIIRIAKNTLNLALRAYNSVKNELHDAHFLLSDSDKHDIDKM